MIKSIRLKITAQPSILSSLVFGPLALLSPSSFAAVNNLDSSQGSPWFWNLVIALIVICATLASAALCIAAYRNWPQKTWRLGALAPVGVLALMLVIIAFARLGDNISHELWPLEIFAWAMLNMIYMVGLMTTKRIFEKADAQTSTS
jgi:peptidoglycan/LPS O-acetylase OafA/YrhL